MNADREVVSGGRLGYVALVGCDLIFGIEAIRGVTRPALSASVWRSGPRASTTRPSISFRSTPRDLIPRRSDTTRAGRSRRSRRQTADIDSSLTHRWREVDSNFQSVVERVEH